MNIADAFEFQAFYHPASLAVCVPGSHYGPVSYGRLRAFANAIGRRCLGASFALFEMKVVLSTILKWARLQPASEAPEPVRRRALTFAPARDALVVMDELKPPQARDAGRAPAAAG